MAITKFHKPIEIFKLLYNTEISIDNLWHIESTKESDIKFSAYIGSGNVILNDRQYIFLNNRPVHCPLILQMVLATFIAALHNCIRTQYWQIPKKETIFILLFITCKEYFFTIENGKKTLILPKIQDLLQSVRNEILNTFAKNNTMCLSKSALSHIKGQKNLIYSCENNFNNAKLFENTLIHRELRASKRACVLHTFCHIIKKRTTTLKILPIFENTTNKQKASINCFDRMKLNSINTQVECKSNETQCKMSLNQLKINETTDAVQLLTPASQNNTISKETVTLTLSEWSNWTYPDNGSYSLKKINKLHSNSQKFYKHFNFLPEKLHKLLRGNTKLTKTDILNESRRSISAKLKIGLPSM